MWSINPVAVSLLGGCALVVALVAAAAIGRFRLTRAGQRPRDRRGARASGCRARPDSAWLNELTVLCVLHTRKTRN